MPEVNSPQRLSEQIRQIRAAFARQGVSINTFPPGAPAGQAEFLFRPDRVLARADRAVDVTPQLNTRLGPANVSRHDPIPGLSAFSVSSRSAAEMLQLVDDVNAAVPDPRGPVVAIDHVLHITSASCCPATEPELVGGHDLTTPPDPVPPVNPDAAAGGGVKVAVIDTGLLSGVVQLHSWLRNAPKVDGEPEDPDPILSSHYRGHGTFVAGVLRAMAPKAEVYVHALMSSGGAICESDLVPRLVAALDTGPHFISMSAGTRTTAANVLLGLQVFRDDHLSHTNTILVCAAGNDGDGGPFAPASLGWPEAVAVGALDADGSLAVYSNRGPVGPGDWVDVYARGSDVVNAYPNGAYTYTEPPSVPPKVVQFVNGMAKWSGTSFSTPLVSGLFAAWLSANPGKQPKDAWAALKIVADANAPLHAGRPALP
ncbi:S8 family peptidase [Intrasporangium oryzae]|nr:S8 family serine peptidase [Intrasporangium oryzae]